MNTALLGPSRQYLGEDFILKTLADLVSRGYTENEVIEVHKRAVDYLQTYLEPDPVSGEIRPFRRDYQAAISDVLAESIDIACGEYA